MKKSLTVILILMASFSFSQDDEKIISVLIKEYDEYLKQIPEPTFFIDNKDPFYYYENYPITESENDTIWMASLPTLPDFMEYLREKFKPISKRE